MKFIERASQVITTANLKNAIGYLAIIISIFGFGFAKETVAMGLGIAGSAIFLAFSNIDKFVRFKGAGFEAEMRDIVNDANASLKNLKSVATPLISSYITNLANEDLMFSSNSESKISRYDQIELLQKELGITHPSITQAKRRFLTLECWHELSNLTRNLHPHDEKEQYPDNKYLQLHTKLHEKIGQMNTENTPDIQKAKSYLYEEHSDKADREMIDAAIATAKGYIATISSVSDAD